MERYILKKTGGENYWKMKEVKLSVFDHVLCNFVYNVNNRQIFYILVAIFILK